MKVMTLAYQNKLNSLVLVAGDGDFRDMVDFVVNTMQKPVYIAGYKASMSASLV